MTYRGRAVRAGGLIALVLAVAAPTGCTRLLGGAPVAYLTLPVDGFPGTAGFAAIDPALFTEHDGGPETGFLFTTPEGLVCGMGSYPSWQSAGAECTGPRPDRGPGLWTVDAERFAATTVQTSAMPSGALNRLDHPYKLLPQRHYVVDSADTMCLVTEDSVVACHVGGHGFILTPDRTILF